MKYKELREYIFKELDNNRDEKELYAYLVANGNKEHNVATLISEHPNKNTIKKFNILKYLSFFIYLIICIILLTCAYKDASLTSPFDYLMHLPLLTVFFVPALFLIIKDRPSGYNEVMYGIFMSYFWVKYKEISTAPYLIYASLIILIFFYISKSILFPNDNSKFRKQLQSS